jgi:Spy/CpxP family protein refolding chaperone
MKKTVAYAVALAAVSLAAGVAIGLSIARKPVVPVGPAGPAGYLKAARNKFSPPNKEQIFEHLSRKLNLTPSQEEQIKKILDASREDIKKAVESTRNKFEEIKEKTDGKIKTVLTKEQQAEFDKMTAEVKARMENLSKKRLSPPAAENNAPEASR